MTKLMLQVLFFVLWISTSGGPDEDLFLHHKFTGLMARAMLKGWVGIVSSKSIHL